MTEYLWVFVIGGTICVIAQILLDKTNLMPAHILVLYVVVGAVLTVFGFYDKLVELGHSGATVPIMGFGYGAVKGVIEAVDKDGFLGVFTGGLTRTAAGVSAVALFGYLGALFGNSKTKQ